MKKILNVEIGGIGFAYTRNYMAYGELQGVMDAIQEKFKSCRFGHGIRKGDRLRIGVSETKTGNSIHLPVLVGEDCGS